MEEWKNKLPFSVLRHVEERGECELIPAAKVADAYALLMESLGSRDRGSHYVRSSSGESFGGVGGKPTGTSSANYAMYCTYCKKPGHTIQKCRHPNCKGSQSPNPFVPFKSNYGPKKPVATANIANSPHQLFQPYIFTGKVSLTDSENKVFPIQI
ncbi:hypothetical protein ECANGB1_553 [Enterospora canceri]|uniref:CCHC-type domain-containing protein n=1 Tax=Enterospora canceri TaxID=1081671 RepID=A0A1Y1S5H3_9MICR|nr:hypothetical protein ECANGB1_553 [Enterospora canceri]